MSERRAGWLFIAPALLLLVVFFLLPVALGLVLAVTDFDIYALGDPSAVRFVGAENFRQMVKNPLFFRALVNTCYFVGVGGTLSILLSLLAALALASPLCRWRGFFRTVYFAPVVLTMVAVAVVFRTLYHPDFGLLNRFLKLFGVEPIFWLGDPAWAMPAIILLALWKNFGYNMVIFLAGLSTIPPTLYEAASLDGASRWQQFWHITLPGLRPTLVFVLITTLIGYFQLFAEPYVMTGGGGPVNATLSLVLHMYKEGFRWWNMGYAAAVAVVLFALILLVTAPLRWYQRRWSP
ncbi:MAG: sugar ABC transporter permease [Thermoanaerobaculum sp.]|nr:sugar ABC transporter permease [Thermoanaerobaculum sp.]MCX7895522.1 sugar ABC transporter permease [Thermoanaerobaculum sp.]MDW7968749.1 sugar ABC transporter permease [Thermoanaerobaculum sp.]